MGGITAITLVVFAETGLFFCFWLPGDYLLFLAGVFVGNGLLDVSLLTLITCLVGAAVVGNFTGYFFGKLVGHKLMTRPDGVFFKKKYLDTTKAAFDKYGGKALIIGRFLPIVRTFAPILAGISGMKLGIFAVYNLIGALLWACLLAVSGWYFGEHHGEWIMTHLHWVIMGFLAITTGTVVVNYLKVQKQQRLETNNPKKPEQV